MNQGQLTFTIILASLLTAGIADAQFDGSVALMCSLGQVVECDYGADCRGVTNDAVDAPDFIMLDFDERVFTSLVAGAQGTADTIDNVVDLDNHLIVQAVQGTSAASGDALGWSASINQTTGRMVLTGSGVNAGFVVFGACTSM